MLDLGLVTNGEKSRLSSAQDVFSQGLALNSVTVECQVTPKCLVALCHWRVHDVSHPGITDGCNYVQKIGHHRHHFDRLWRCPRRLEFRGSWDTRFQHLNINLLQLSVVSCFLPLLRGHYVWIQMDNTKTVAYINRQITLTSPQVYLLELRSFSILEGMFKGSWMHGQTDSLGADLWGIDFKSSRGENIWFFFPCELQMPTREGEAFAHLIARAALCVCVPSQVWFPPLWLEWRSSDMSQYS